MKRLVAQFGECQVLTNKCLLKAWYGNLLNCVSHTREAQEKRTQWTHVWNYVAGKMLSFPSNVFSASDSAQANWIHSFSVALHGAWSLHPFAGLFGGTFHGQTWLHLELTLKFVVRLIKTLTSKPDRSLQWLCRASKQNDDLLHQSHSALNAERHSKALINPSMQPTTLQSPVVEPVQGQWWFPF